MKTTEQETNLPKRKKYSPQFKEQALERAARAKEREAFALAVKSAQEG